jgi:zinc finger HIT domain-containing protein 1
MNLKRTRNSLRSRKINQALKVVDEESRDFVLQSKLEALESDYYESPNRLAEDVSEDEYDYDKEDDSHDKTKKKIRKRQKHVRKKSKRDSYVVRNLNLKKTLKEEGLENPDLDYPNFINARVEPPKYPGRKFCSICGNTSVYTCPRCGQRYCSRKCHDVHKDVMCLRFES